MTLCGYQANSSEHFIFQVIKAMPAKFRIQQLKGVGISLTREELQQLQGSADPYYFLRVGKTFYALFGPIRLVREACSSYNARHRPDNANTYVLETTRHIKPGEEILAQFNIKNSREECKCQDCFKVNTGYKGICGHSNICAIAHIDIRHSDRRWQWSWERS